MSVQKFLARFFRFKSLIKVEPPIQLLKETDLTTQALLKKIEKMILEASNKTQILNSSFTNLGGSNNLGFIAHKNNYNYNQEEFVTKLAYSHLINKERLFLNWHSSHVEKKQAFAVTFIASGVLSQANAIEFITTKKLNPIRKPSNQQVLELYKKAEYGVQFFKEKQSQELSFNGGSRIRDCLLNLVCQPNADKAGKFLNLFFNERIASMPKYKEQLNACHQQLNIFMNEIYSNVEKNDMGFVHGDFKASNMLQESDNTLRLIDFQYYCLGFREWDLGFYFSKKKNGIADIKFLFQEGFLEINQKQRLLFFYVVACLLHPKPKKFKKIYKSQIISSISEYGILKSQTKR